MNEVFDKSVESTTHENYMYARLSYICDTASEVIFFSLISAFILLPSFHCCSAARYMYTFF